MRMTSRVTIGSGAVPAMFLAVFLVAGLGTPPARAVRAGTAPVRAAPVQAAGAAGTGHGTVAACRDYGEAAILRHVTVTWVPAACRGLSRSQVNQAVAAAIREVSGGRPKAARRRLAGSVAPELAFLIRAPLPAATPAPVAAYLPSRPVTRRVHTDHTDLNLAALLAWVVTAGSGAYLVARWLAAGGRLRGGGASSAAPPGTVVAHFVLAVTGLVLWIAFLLAGWPVLAWTAGALLIPVAGLGMGLVTVGLPVGLIRRSSGSNGSNGSNGARRRGRIRWASVAGEPQEWPPGERPLANGPAGNGPPGHGVAGNGSARAAMAARSAPSAATALKPPPVPAVRAPRRPGRVPVLVVAAHGVLAAATLFLVLLAAVGSGGAF